jgi:hypothetical protein
VSDHDRRRPPWWAPLGKKAWEKGKAAYQSAKAPGQVAKSIIANPKLLAALSAAVGTAAVAGVAVVQATDARNAAESALDRLAAADRIAAAGESLKRALNDLDDRADALAKAVKRGDREIAHDVAASIEEQATRVDKLAEELGAGQLAAVQGAAQAARAAAQAVREQIVEDLGSVEGEVSDLSEAVEQVDATVTDLSKAVEAAAAVAAGAVQRLDVAEPRLPLVGTLPTVNTPPGTTVTTDPAVFAIPIEGQYLVTISGKLNQTDRCQTIWALRDGAVYQSAYADEDGQLTLAQVVTLPVGERSIAARISAAPEGGNNANCQWVSPFVSVQRLGG